jgi:hypothetical protein
MSRARTLRSVLVATLFSAALVAMAVANAVAGDGGGPFPH